MREALARSDNDFTIVEKPRGGKRKASLCSTEAAPRFGLLMQRPMRNLAFVVSAGILVGIGVNATMLQTARHPAPLFKLPEAAPAPQKSAAAAPMPAPRPVAFAAPAPAPAPAAAPLAAPAPAAAPIARPVPQRSAAAPARAESEIAPPRRDAIAALLRGAEPAGPSPRVAAVQRALQKVGYVISPNGVFGASTRQAIERYERDHNLPVTGEAAGRTMRQLGADSGVAIP